MERKLVWIAAGLGLVFAVGLAIVRWVNSPLGFPGVEWFGNLAFLVVYSAPFLAALAALSFRAPVLQAGIWLGSGILAGLASMSAFSGVTLVLIIPSLVLLLVGLLSMARAAGHTGIATLGGLLLSAALVGVGIASFAALFLLPATPYCWRVRQLPDGQQVAEQDPNAVVSATGSGGGSTFSGTSVVSPNPLADGSVIKGQGCTSDLITPIEAGLSVGLWLVMLVGFWQVRQSQFPSHLPVLIKS